jgi:hypothetical protein
MFLKCCKDFPTSETESGTLPLSFQNISLLDTSSSEEVMPTIPDSMRSIEAIVADRQTAAKRDRERERQRDRERQRKRERQRDRQIKKERDRDRDDKRCQW